MTSYDNLDVLTALCLVGDARTAEVVDGLEGGRHSKVIATLKLLCDKGLARQTRFAGQKMLNSMGMVSYAKSHRWCATDEGRALVGR